ncbi:hypothetical protein SAMN04489713_11162 [Actinomadura madurae]|uniref:Uncharacterized protein n=1 Tax=Actinomadura madurae TaxID=1993 RepID=A0A1I5LX60_9ACTN|nr:hypothetical protein SAMN04489713_11162 [Actinomadura madurae]
MKEWRIAVLAYRADGLHYAISARDRYADVGML